jgi:hypothetical protein
MDIAYLVVTVVLAAMATFSALGKLHRHPKIVHVVHEVVGVPLQYFPHLAACEFAGALGLVLGICLASYFVGAIVSHLQVGDVKGIGPAAFMLSISVTALALRVLAHKTGVVGVPT